MDNNALGGGFLHLEAGGGGHLGHGVLAGVHLLPLFMHLDFAPGIGENIPVVDGAGGLRRLAVAGVGDVELGPLNRSARHAVLLKNGQLRGLVVAENQRLFIAWVQGNCLHTVFILIRQIIGRGYRFLRHLICAGGNPQGSLAVLAGSPIVLIVPVDSFYGEHSAGDRLTTVSVNLGDRQLRLFKILKNDFLLIAAIQADGLGWLITDTVRLRDRLLRYAITAGSNPQLHGAAGLGGNFVAVIAVNGFQQKHRTGDGIARTLFNFGNFQKRLFEIIKNQLLIVTSLQPNGLRGFIPHHIGGGNGLLNHFIAVHGDIGEDGPAVCAGSHIVVVAVVDALDLKMGIGDHISSLRVPFQNRQVGEPLVGGCHGDGAAAVDSGLIHMGDDRLCEGGVGSRGTHLHKSVHSLGHIGDGNGAVRFGGLRADNLAVLDDVEHRAGEGIVAVIQFDKFYLYLGVIFKHQGNVALAVPAEGLLSLIHIGAFGVALRGCHFLGGVAANGHILPGNVGQIAALAGDEGSSKIIVHALNFNDRPGEALGGVIRVHLADTALAGDFGAVGKGDGYGVIAIAGQDHILRASVVDLIALRGLQFSHGVSARFQGGQGIGSAATRYDLLGVGAVFRSHLKSRSGQALVGIGAVYLLDSEIILLTGDIQFPNHNGLYVAGRMIVRAGASVSVLIDGAIAPYALRPQVEDILGAVTERSAVHRIVNAGIAGMLQIVIDVQQFLGASGHGVCQQTGLVAPDNRLHPGVHRPCVVAVPHIIHVQGVGLIGKYAGRVGVEKGHHGLDGGIGNGLGITPRVALQGPAHALAFLGAEAHGTLSIKPKVHLVEMAGAQSRGFIFDPVMSTVVHLDGAGACRQRRGRQQAQDTHQHQQHSRYAGEGEPDFFHMLKNSFPFCGIRKGPSAWG